MFGLSQRRIACIRVSAVIVVTIILVILFISMLPNFSDSLFGPSDEEEEFMSSMELDRMKEDYLLDNKYEDDFGHLQEAAEEDNIFEKMVVPSKYT